MPEYTAITYDVNDSVATITLNRPEAANSLNEALSSQMLDAIIRSEENKEVRALIISGGTGRFFFTVTRLRICTSPVASSTPSPPAFVNSVPYGCRCRIFCFCLLS